MSDQSREEQNEEYQGLCQGIGHLFILFGRLETTFAALLKIHLASKLEGGLDPRGLAFTSALYGGMRLAAARDTYRRLIRAEGPTPEIETFLDQFFAHIGAVSSFRDHLAHKFVGPAPSGLGAPFLVTDAVNTRAVKSANVWVFNTEAVLSAAHDLDLAADRLGGVSLHRLADPKTFDISPVPWRYKQKMLRPVDQKILGLLPGL